MASDVSEEVATHPVLNLTAKERQFYGQLFRQADPDGAGIVMGEAAVKFFEKTRLDSRILGEIWQIADIENRGFLTPAGFGIALRLIGHAQSGKEPSLPLASQPGLLPRFDGIAPLAADISPPPSLPTSTGLATPLTSQGTGNLGAAGLAPQLAPQGTGSIGARVPPLPVDKAAQYAKVFQDQTQGAPVLAGDRAKRIFEKSGLPNEILGRIWQLSDTEQRGGLVQTEFIIAMHLLTSIKMGNLRSLPPVLPAALYEAATRGASAGPAAGGPGSPIALSRQTTGQMPVGPLRPVGTGFSGTAAPAVVSPNNTGSGGDWLITPAEKARVSSAFASLDKTKKGFITGEEAVPFLKRSGLNEDVLAQIWDLADVNSEGRLTLDTFAVALHLIQQQLQRGDGTTNLPAKLPLNLIPPSMRSAQPRNISSPVAPLAQPPAQVPQPKSAMDDLFGLDSGPASSASLPPALSATSGAATDPFSGGSTPIPPSSPARLSPPAIGSSTFKPFVPSSTFGKTLNTQVTGGSNSSGRGHSVNRPSAPAPAPAPAHGDLLGDDDDGEASKSVSNDTVELANLSNQIGSLSKHMQETQAHRTTLQTELSQTSVQKKNFEQRLTQLRAAYEKEARDVRGLEEQLKTSRAETKKLQTDAAVLEATYRDLQTQHQQMTTALRADQQENASLKERLRVVSAEVNQLKPQVEKLKSEARQQKGIVAINRKQLSLGESERDKLKTEAEDLTRQNAELARQIHNASVVSDRSMNGSPSVSSSSGTNPFMRRTGSSDIMGVFSPPPLPAQHTGGSAKLLSGEQTFDDVFGPAPKAAVPAATSASKSASTSDTPAPAFANAFKPQITGASTASGTSSAFSAVTAPTSDTATPGTVTRQPTLAAESSTEFPSSGGPLPSASSNEATAIPGAVPGAFPTPPAAASPVEAVAISHETDSDKSSANAEPQPASKSPSSGGAFPLAAAGVTAGAAAVAAAGAAGIAAAATSPSADGNAKEPSSFWGHAHNDSLSDPFAALDKDQDKAKEDFASAFASFKAAKAASEPAAGESGVAGGVAGSASSSGTATDFPAVVKGEDNIHTDTAKALASFNTEFPPISELERDESDSDSDHGGFEDDFAPASPPNASGQAQKKDTSAVGESSASKPVAVPATATGSGTEPAADDGIGESSIGVAKVPSPALEESTTGTDASSELVTQGSTAENNFSKPLSSSNLDDIFAVTPPKAKARAGEAEPTANDKTTEAAAGPATAASGASAPEAIFDDLDDDFEGLEDAREGSGDDDFANISRSGLEDFQAGFDSSPQTTQGLGTDGSFDFGSTATTTQNGGGFGAKAPVTAGDNGVTDWFSMLDENKAGSSHATGETATAASKATESSVTRPTPGRTVTEDSTNDDPILKKLTSMGYARSMALNALEKYDYNVDRAANYLASQS